MGTLADSFKLQLDILNGRRASASQRDGVIMQLRDRKVPREFIDAHLPQSEDGPALLAGAEKAIDAYRNTIVAGLKSRGVADEVIAAHVPADASQSAYFADGAARALASQQAIVPNAASAGPTGGFLRMGSGLSSGQAAVAASLKMPQ